VGINSVRILLGLLLLLPTLAHGVPQCSDIFTNLPSGKHNPGLVQPANMPSLGPLSCGKNGCTGHSSVFAPGDYNFTSGTFANKSYMSTQGASSRLYFDSLSLTNANLNAYGGSKNLIVYVRGDLSISGQTYIKGIVYVSGNVTVTGIARIEGALAAGGSINYKKGSVTVELQAVADADFGGMCSNVPPPSRPDHYRLSFSSQALSCKAQPISLQACSNSSCSGTFASATSVDLTKNAAVYGSQSFTGSTSVNVWHGTGGTVTLGLINPSPAATNSYRCYIDGNLVTDNANCRLTYADSGLLFDIPDKLANRPETIVVLAVKKSDSTQTCVPAFTGDKTLSFWSGYLSPSSITSGQSITVNGSSIGKSSTSKTPITLSFDDEGKAPMTMNYADAGKVQLDAQYTGTGNEQGLVIIGSDSFVSFPVGLCVTPKESSALCSTGDASCNVYKKAGEAFDLIIQGKAWQSDGDNDYCDNLDTPNYAQEGFVLGHNIVAPSGGELGILGNSGYNHKTAATNSNTVTQSVSEVGVFNFTAIQPASYLGASYCSVLSLGTNCTMPSYVSSSIGRFVPTSFGVSDPLVMASCATFSYMDQSFSTAYTLSALNLNGQLTQNYAGAFAKAVVSLAGEDSNSGVDLSTRLSMPALDNSSWVKGSANITSANLALFTRLTAPQQDGPFESLDIGLKVQDNDGDFAFVNSPDMNASNSQLPCINCDAKILGVTKIRHGRIVMDNTYGPESETLNMPTYAQYWNGAWVTNSNDSCSTVTAALDGSEVYSPVLTTGQVVLRGPLNPQMLGGALALTWDNTGSSDYRGQVTAPLGVSPWLKWYWNWDGLSPNALVNPRGSAFFGRYRGHDRIIYWRETE
jgi:MSHA biogenesis protein MshQ